MKFSIIIIKQITMKGNMSKFMKHLSDDIVSENHHLKNEIITIRKALKNYEQTIVDQLSKMAEQMSLPLQQQNQNGYFFESPNQCLNYFIMSIKKNISLTNQLSTINKQLKTEIKQLRTVNIDQQSEISNLLKKEQSLTKKLTQLSKNHKILKNQHTMLSELHQEVKNKLNSQIEVLNAKIEKMDEEYKLKMLEEKQIIMEKTNKDIAKFRVEMDTEMYQKEKAMRLENQKRDKQIRSLLNTINSIVQKKQKTSKSNPSNPTIGQPSSKQPKKAQPQSTTNTASLSVLSQVIKPFTEYTNMNEKISQLRKQSLSLKNQLRQVTSSYNIATTSMKQKQNENAILVSKVQKTILKNQQLFDELVATKEELNKSLEDKDSMEKYYNQRWNTEFNKVKYHIEKKYADKEQSLEQEYTSLKEAVLIQRETMAAENLKFKKQTQEFKNLNKGLLAQLTLLSVEKQSSKQSLKEARRKFIEIDKMHNEDTLANVLILDEKMKKLRQIIFDKEHSIKILANKIEGTQNQTLKRLQFLRNEINNEHQKQVSQIKAEYQQIIDEKNSKIQKFSTQIESHKQIITFLQKQEGEKIEELKKNISKERQRQMRDAKVAHYEQIGKLNQKILKYEQKIKQLKQQLVQEHIKHTSLMNQKQKTISQKQSKIVELQSIIKYLQGQQKTYIKEIENLRNIRTVLEQRIASFRVEINSQNLIISNKDRQIFTLSQKRNEWKNDIEACQKQFEKGFKQINQLNNKKIQRLKSRIWELERVCETKGISKREYEKIRSLTEQKKQLKEQVVMKQAQNLILTQVKNYYETKSKQLDSKMVLGFEFKNDKHPVFVRKPKRSITQAQYIKSQVVEDLATFTGREAVQIKKINNQTRTKGRSTGRMQTSEQMENKKRSRVVSRSNARVSSSLM